MVRETKVRLLAALVLGLVFGTGLIVGLAVDRTAEAALSEGSVATAEAGDEATGETPAEDESAERSRRDDRRRPPMYRQVGELSPEQEAVIDSIMSEHRERYQALERERRAQWEEMEDQWRAFERQHRPRMDSLVQQTREAILGVMTPEQAERYRALLERTDRSDRDRNRDRDDRDQETEG